VQGVDDLMLDKLVALGCVSVADLDELGPEPLTENLEIEPELAERIVYEAGEEVIRLEEEKEAAEKAKAEAEAAGIVAPTEAETESGFVPTEAEGELIETPGVDELETSPEAPHEAELTDSTAPEDVLSSEGPIEPAFEPEHAASALPEQDMPQDERGSGTPALTDTAEATLDSQAESDDD
jgi:hypothetical protein